MSNKKFIIHLAGPSGAGKTTILKLLSEKIPSVYTISYDKQKFQLSGYDRDKHGLLVKDIVFDFFKAIFQYELSIFLDVPLRTEEEYFKYYKYSQDHDYKFIAIVLTAPQKILVERFHERLENSRKTGSRLTINTEELFLKQIKKEFFVPNNAVEFDTSESGTDIIVERIIKLID